MGVSAISNTGSTVTQTQTTSNSGNILGKDDFLKLLVTQMQNQNPLEPISDQEFIAQMAQFSSLELLQNLAQQAEASQALSLVGTEITVSSGDKYITGVVEKVMFSNGQPLLMIGNQPFTLSQVVQVTLPSQASEEDL